MCFDSLASLVRWTCSGCLVLRTRHPQSALVTQTQPSVGSAATQERDFKLLSPSLAVNRASNTASVTVTDNDALTALSLPPNLSDVRLLHVWGEVDPIVWTATPLVAKCDSGARPQHARH